MPKYLLILLFAISCTGTTPDKGTWTGTWKDQPVTAEWTPAQPRIGDYVNLTLRFPQGLPEARLLGGLPPVLLSSPETLEYRHLVRRPGAFHPQDFSSPLWTVSPASEEPWLHLRTRAVFTPLPWSPWLWGVPPVLAGLMGFLLWRHLPRGPKSMDFKKWRRRLLQDSEKINSRELYKELQKAWETAGLEATGEEDRDFWERLQKVLYRSYVPSKDEMIQDLYLGEKRLKEGRGV